MVNLIDYLRKVRDGLIYRQHFQSAVFLSDKILALKPSSAEDIFILGKCLFRLKEYQRAAYIITCRNLHQTDISCCLLVIKCYVSVDNKSVCFICRSNFNVSISVQVQKLPRGF